MFRPRILMSCGVVGLLSVLSAPKAARAETDFSRFPLCRALPEDVCAAVVAKGNPDRDFIQKHWQRVYDELESVGVLDDVWNLIMGAAPAEERDKVEAAVGRLSKLWKAIDWADLFRHEMLVAGRLNSAANPGGPFEAIMIGRMNAEDVRRNYTGFKFLVGEIDTLIKKESREEVLRVEEKELAGGKVLQIGPKDSKTSVISIGYRKDMIFLTLFGDKLLEDSLARLGSSEKLGRLVDTPRWKAAFKDLPAGEDVVGYFNAAAFFQELRGYVQAAVKGVVSGQEQSKAEKSKSNNGDRGEDDEDDVEAEDEDEDQSGSRSKDDSTDPDASPEHVLRMVFDDLSCLDHAALTVRTEGQRVIEESMTALADGAEDRQLMKVFTPGVAWSDLAKMIPQEATGFSCHAGMNWKAMYELVLNYLRDGSPEGEKALEQWAGLQEQIGFNLERDILKPLTGPFTSISMEDDWAMLVRVPDEKKANRAFKRLIRRINGALGESGGLTMTPVDVEDESGFVQIVHPMMMMLGGMTPPVVGCAEGHFMIGSRASALAKVIKTARGKLDNITKNEQFIEDGAKPHADMVASASFKDERDFGSKLENGINSAAMLTGMISMFGAELSPEGQRLMSALPGIMAKFAQVAGKLDFFKSKSACTTFDKNGWRTTTIQTYKAFKEKSRASEKHVERDKAAKEKAATKEDEEKEEDDSDDDWDD